MPTQTADPAPPTPPVFLTAIFNAVFSSILRSPLHPLLSRRFILLSFHGRKSGKMYRVVVGYERNGDELEIISPRSWWKNLRGGNAPVTVLLEGKKRDGIATGASRGDDLSTDVFLRFVRLHPSLIRMYGIEQEEDGQPKLESVRLAARHVAIVRIRL